MFNSELHAGEWALLEAHLPGKTPERIGLILRDASRNALCARIRPEWSARDDESEIWQDLAADLERMASDIGAVKALDWLENSASQAIRLSARHAIEFADPEIAFETLYAQHISRESIPVQSEEPILGHVSSTWSNVQRAVSTYGWLFALAATITFIVGRSVRSSSVTQLSSITKETLAMERADVFPIFPLRPASLQLGISEPENTFRSRHGAALRAYRPHSRKPFQLHNHVNLLVKVKPVVTEVRVPPSLHIPIENSTQDLSSVLGTVVPSLPEFRPRHRRFVRALAAPFRMLGILVVGRRDT